MIPENRFSSTTLKGQLYNPWSRRAGISQHWGPVEIQDLSQGLGVRLWKAQAIGADMVLSAPGVLPSTWYTHTEDIKEISLAFDQNGRPCIAFVGESGGAFLRWFDPVPNAIVNLDMSAFGGVTPRVTLDDNRPFNGANSDVILGYVRAGVVRYRLQRDRFTEEYTPTIGTDGPEVEAPKLYHISMNSTFRLQFILDDSSPLPRTPPGYAYEIDRGWSFDGNYIPHFAELNWYFGDNPVDFTGIQKIRIHGLSKGRALLQVATNGMEPEDLSYLPDYSEPQWCDLPKRPYYVSKDYVNVTNYTDTANRGLSIQMKFEGRNTDITKPEPSHVLQVLVLQASPQGTGARGN